MIKKKKEKLKKIKKKKSSLTLNKTKLNKLIELDNLEDIYHLIDVLDEKQTEKLILHYKKTKLKEKSKISNIMHQTNSKKELQKAIQEEIVSEVREKFERLAEKIREKRKKGEDVYIEWVRSLSIPLKIKVYEATLDKKDFFKIKKRIEDIENKLENKIEARPKTKK